MPLPWAGLGPAPTKWAEGSRITVGAAHLGRPQLREARRGKWKPDTRSGAEAGPYMVTRTHVRNMPPFRKTTKETPPRGGVS